MKKLYNPQSQPELELLKHHQRAYYNWCKLVLTLSTGSLTLSVSLYGLYVNSMTQFLYLLQISWFLFLLSILFGLLTLYGEVQTPLDILNDLQEEKRSKSGHQQTNEKPKANLYKVRKIFVLPAYIMVLFFLLALFLLAIFAGLNLP